jgi:hypothetical protein
MHGKITIGDLEFTSFNSFTIEESIKETSDKATIVLARNYKELLGKPVLQHIKSGMPVTIDAGYNNDLVTEYTGFVKPGIPAGEFPLTIECDELYPLRQNNHILSYRSVTLKKLLQTVCPGYTIEGVDTDLGKIGINNKSSYQVLDYLKKEYGFYSRIYGKTLHCGFAFDFSPSNTKKHDYTIGENVKDYSKLKFEEKKDFNTRVELHVRQSNGKKEIYKFGSDNPDASVRRETSAFMGSGDARRKAEALFHQYTYAGYSGTISGFGFPRVHAGDSIQIINQVHPERQGTYLVEKTTIKYDEAMIERENGISFKVAS